jgi:L-alanine-DL-glutamate epimerase-like enolase superfamily enzyme
MKLTAQTIDLHTANKEFRIARAVQSAFQVVILRVEHDGVVGLGEAAPSAYYGGENVAAIHETVAAAQDLLGDDPLQLEDITARLGEAFPERYATVSGIDIALHDLAGKLLGVPVYRMLGLNPALTPVTSYTISIDEPSLMAERAAAAAKSFKVIKIKVGTERDDERLAAIRAATDVRLRLDANTGWDKEETIRHLERWAGYGIEFVEQPIPPGDNEALRWIRQRSPVPIMADESCVDSRDLPGLVDCVDAINIKLMKCKGLREALRMIHIARAHGLKIMLGCMLETSIAITAAAQLSPLVDYADLDGNLLLADDPFTGVTVRDGRLVLPDGPGLGIRER